MAATILISGIPNKLRLDGWWLADDFRVQTPAEPRHQSLARQTGRFPVLILGLVLVVLADFLFWDHPVGLSIALFSIAFSAMILLAKPKVAGLREWGVGMGFAVIANLPVIETLQPLSLMFSGLGILALAVWASEGLRQTGKTIAARVFRLVFLWPFSGSADLWLVFNNQISFSTFMQILAQFLLPAVFGAAFITLFILANPFLEQWLEQVFSLNLLTPEMILRMVFWVLVLMVVWPYLNLKPFKALTGTTDTKPNTSTAKPFWDMFINPNSVRVSLLLFNGLFALQTGMDMLVLSGGMTLPEGMSYASYAHRGAYPLVVTALLAGGFAIGTRRMIIANRFLRGLVYLWLLQNLFLVLSAGFRLNLYVEQFALTHLRIAAFIWMFMVFVGLMLVFVQISKQKTNGWLMGCNTVLLLAVLYVSSMVNFSYIIAAYNVEHAPDAYVFTDGYLCTLGPQALPVLLAQRDVDPLLCNYGRMPEFIPNAGWRDFGFRDWRLEQTLAELRLFEPAP